MPIAKLTAANGNAKKLEKSKSLKPLNRTLEKCLTALRQANKGYIENLQYEVEDFIRQTAASYHGKTTMVFFSGGKDSTVVSHLMMNAMGRSDVLHIFADTTLWFVDMDMRGRI
ncbi:MAG: hypothetical protein L3J69_02115 [Desulfobacula sp.]|nr:hypothetical protein [Desulfobacula sp.]